MRRLIASLSCLAIVIGIGALSAPTASASTNLGTVTVAYNPNIMGYGVTPSTLTGTAGDTFTLMTMMTDNANSWTTLVGPVGVQGYSFTACSATSVSACHVNDVLPNGGANGQYEITGTGTVAVWRQLNGGSPSQIGTITISSGGSGGSSESTTPPVPTFTLNYNANGGVCNVLSSGPVSSGAWVPVPGTGSCTKAGSALSGFSTSSTNASSGLFFAPDAMTQVTGDNTLYAIWSAATPAPTPTPTASPTAVAPTRAPVLGANWVYTCLTPTYVTSTWNATTQRFEAPLPTNAGCDNSPYVLMSWNTKVDGTGTSVAPGATVTLTTDTWYAAQWGVPITYNFHPNTTECPTQTVVIPVGNDFTILPPSACTRPDTAIASWATTSTPTVTFAPGMRTTAMIPVTLYAQWAAPITIRFSPDGGTCTAASTTIGSGGWYAMPSIDDCQKTGYRLIGWAFTADATRDPFFFEPGAAFPAFKNFTVIAQWQSTSHCNAPAAPNVDWHGCDKRNLDLSGVDLTKADLSYTLFNGATLTNVDFSGATLTGTKFAWANLSGARFRAYSAPGFAGMRWGTTDLAGIDFTGAHLVGIDIWGANLKGAILTGTNLTKLDAEGADFTGAFFGFSNMTDANLTGANLTGANLTLTNLAGAKLPNANLSKADLSGLVLKGLDFSGANLSSATLDRANLSNANLTSAALPFVTANSTSLKGAALTNADATSGDFTNANLTNVSAQRTNFNSVTMNATTLSGANLAGTYLGSAKLSNLNLSGVDLNHADLSDATLTKVTVGSANLVSATLQKMNLTGQDFSKANIKGASFHLSNLTNVDFSGRDVTNSDFSTTTLSNTNFANAYTALVGRGCVPEGYQRNSQVTVKQAMRNLPTVSGAWLEEWTEIRGGKPTRVGEMRYGNVTWGIDGKGDFLIYCARS